MNASPSLRDLARLLRDERTAFAVLSYAALVLVITPHLAVPVWLPGVLPSAFVPLARFVWWVAELTVLWGIVPLLIARALGFTARQLGLGAGHLRRLLPLYAVLGAVAIGGVFLAARQEDFRAMYPLIERDVATWSWRLLVGYALLYTAQFVLVEFLFRGFLLFPLRARFGDAAIAVTLAPYALLHAGKPLAEGVLAIVGGTALGWLALRAETIWGGVLVHAGMALALDAVALTFAGEWPTRW